MFGRGDKRGLSTVVATLLIILLTIVAIGIVWVILRNVILNQSEFAKTQKDFFSEDIQIAHIRVNSSSVNISLGRTGGSTKVSSQETENKTVDWIVQADVVSVVDLSSSMAPTCNGITQNCCRNTLGGNYASVTQVCSNVDSSRETICTTTCGGEWIDKLYAAKDANRELMKIISQAEGSRVGFVGYNTSVISSAGVGLTNDLGVLNNTINSWKSAGNTCICCGINEAVRILQQQSSDGKSKKIILMSDGEANRECIEQNTHNATLDAMKAACDAEKNLNNLIIYTVGVGGEVNEATLINISLCGGGKYFSALNVSELVDVYKSVVEVIKSNSKSVSTFNYLYIVFYNGTQSYREKITEIPDALVVKNYKFDLTGKLSGNIIKIEVYPVIISDSGKEIIGPLFDSWEAK